MNDHVSGIVFWLLMLSFSAVMSYYCFFRPESFDIHYQSQEDKPKRLLGKEIPDKAKRHDLYRQVGITGIVIALFAIFGLVRSIIDLINS